MKVKLVYETDGEREVIITIKNLPRVGEQLVMGATEVAEVTKIVHTPSSREHDAIVHLRRLEA